MTDRSHQLPRLVECGDKAVQLGIVDEGVHRRLAAGDEDGVVVSAVHFADRLGVLS